MEATAEAEKKASMENIDIGRRTIALLVSWVSARGASMTKTEAASARSLGASIVRFQERFSNPIPLLSSFQQTKLDTPRDTAGLVKLRSLYELPVESSTSTDAFPTDGVVLSSPSDGRSSKLCIAGSPAWRAMVQRGKLTGDDAVALDVTEWLWISDLFSTLDAISRQFPATSPELSECRRLAAVWYYIATEADLSPDTPPTQSEGGNKDSERQVVEMVGKLAETAKAVAFAELRKNLETLGGGNPLPEDDEEDDDDFMPDDEDDEDCCDDADGGDEEMATEEAAAATTEGDEKEREILASLMDEAMTGGDDQEEEEEEDPKTKEVREGILKVVEELGAFMPSPSTDMPFFKLMLKKLRLRNPCYDDWFPWGKPPVAKVVEVAEALHAKGEGDSDKAEFLGEILVPFYNLQQQQQQGTSTN